VRRLLAASVLAVLPALAQSNFFPVAVWYGGGKARAPMLEKDPRAKKEQWRADVRQIRALGFNTIRAWIDWSSGEPDERRYNFDTLDVLLQLAEEEKLKLILQVYMDSAPSWVGRRYPDSLFVSSNGDAIHPESAPGYCRDHIGVRASDLAFYRALAERTRRSPAFYGWDLWSEPHVINWANPTYISHPEFCFCPHTRARFRTWLKKKYPTLEALNEAWYRTYRDWSEVEPNRLSTILSFTDYIDWKTFIADKLAEDLRDRRDAVKQVAPGAVITSHAAGVGLFASPLHWEGQSDDWSMAPQVDFYGTSFYPKHSAFVDRDPVWRAALLDFTRSFGFQGKRNGFWIGELQSGFGTIALNVSTPVTPDDIRIWTWSALARGAKAINYYAWYPMSTGYESGGFGMINLDGSITERARAAGRIAAAVNENASLFVSARPTKAQVAIVYNPLAHFVGGRQRAAAYGGPQGEVAGIERDSLLGIYKALFSTNAAVDYVHVQHLDELGQYRLVYLPYPLMLPASAAAPLRDFVQRGGALAAEARAGWNNERGRAADVIPGLGLHEWMGVAESSVETAAKGASAFTWNGSRIPGRWFKEVLEPRGDGARVIARFEDGSPAAVESAYGRGRTLMLGTYVSAAYYSEPQPSAEKFFAWLLEWAGVENTLPVTGPVEVRQLQTGNGRLIFLFNHSRQAATVEFRMDAATAWRDIEAGSPLTVKADLMPPRTVRVLYASPRQAGVQ